LDQQMNQIEEPHQKPCGKRRRRSQGSLASYTEKFSEPLPSPIGPSGEWNRD
jgi:hypothetical protein